MRLMMTLEPTSMSLQYVKSASSSSSVSYTASYILIRSRKSFAASSGSCPW